MDAELIEQRIDKTVAGAVAVSDAVGGVMFKDMMQVMEFAKMMSVAAKAVPKHLRANPGACLAICVQALEWHMSPFSVANKSYEVNDRIGYEAQLIMTVINARAPLQKRLRFTYSGEGTAMSCTVSGLLKGEVEPLEYTSPKISEIKVKNSPLWTSDPRQQLSYYSARNWARRHCPEVILGIYAEDELRDAEIGAENARDVTPESSGLKERLAGQKGRKGFHANNTEALPPPSDSDKPLNIVLPGTKDAAPVEVKMARDQPQEAAKEVSPVEQKAEEAAPVSTELETDELRDEYLPVQIDAAKDADTIADLDAINASVRATLTKQDRNDLLGEWNAAYLDRKRTLSTLKSARQSEGVRQP